jgi:hypothetical protein
MRKWRKWANRGQSFMVRGPAGIAPIPDSRENVMHRALPGVGRIRHWESIQTTLHISFAFPSAPHCMRLQTPIRGRSKLAQKATQKLTGTESKSCTEAGQHAGWKLVRSSIETHQSSLGAH